MLWNTCFQLDTKFCLWTSCWRWKSNSLIQKINARNNRKRSLLINGLTRFLLQNMWKLLRPVDSLHGPNCWVLCSPGGPQWCWQGQMCLGFSDWGGVRAWLTPAYWLGSSGYLWAAKVIRIQGGCTVLRDYTAQLPILCIRKWLY